MKFSKIWNDDWLAGTHPLTPEERGVFITLVCHFVNKDYMVPDDDRHLARMCNCSTRTYKRIKNTLIAGVFIEIKEGMISIERAKKQAENDRNFASNQAEKAAKRWAFEKSKALKNNNTASDPACPEHHAADHAIPSPSPLLSDKSLNSADAKKASEPTTKKGNGKDHDHAERLRLARLDNPNFVSSPCLAKAQKEFPYINVTNLETEFQQFNRDKKLTDPDAAFFGFVKRKAGDMNLPPWEK